MNVFKWEFIKCVRRIWLAVAVIGISIAIIGLLLLLRVSNFAVLCEVLNILELPIFAGGVYLTLVYPVLGTIRDLREKHALLERLSGCSYYKVLFVKMIVNLAVVLFALVLVLSAGKLMQHFEVSIMDALDIPMDILLDMKRWLTVAVFLPVIAAFCWLVIPLIYSSHLAFWRFMLCVSVVSVTLLMTSEATALSSGAATLVECLVAVLAFVASGLLYEKKYNIEV